MSRILLLHGASSAGKTSVGRALWDLLRDPAHMFMPVDDFMRMLPPHAYEAAEQLEKQFDAFVHAYHACLAAYARSGLPVIADHVFAKEAWFDDFVTTTRGLEVTWIGLDCPLEILERRERHRGDRKPGLARSQAARVHEGKPYDLRIDTADRSPRECAAFLAKAIARSRAD